MSLTINQRQIDSEKAICQRVTSPLISITQPSYEKLKLLIKNNSVFDTMICFYSCNKSRSSRHNSQLLCFCNFEFSADKTVIGKLRLFCTNSPVEVMVSNSEFQLKMIFVSYKRQASNIKT